MPSPSTTHLVLIPSYNPGSRVYETVRAARHFWNPVWVIVDGSTNGTTEELQQLAAQDPGLSIITLLRNVGKGLFCFAASTSRRSVATPARCPWIRMASIRPSSSRNSWRRRSANRAA